MKQGNIFLQIEVVEYQRFMQRKHKIYAKEKKEDKQRERDGRLQKEIKRHELAKKKKKSFMKSYIHHYCISQQNNSILISISRSDHNKMKKKKKKKMKEK
uniref:Uncharacterized protein n=1 Tax=Octopus bimaculoides TaxID=37653 RepID=A0A0L8GA25_OCTBM